MLKQLPKLTFADMSLFLRFATELSSALNVLHGSRIVHSDLKLRNILFYPTTATIQLIDFDLARKVVDQNRALRSTLVNSDFSLRRWNANLLTQLVPFSICHLSKPVVLVPLSITDRLDVDLIAIIS